MTGQRARLVTKQGDETHVSAVVLAPDEAADMLETEALMHERTDWLVHRFMDSDGTLIRVHAMRGSTRRSIIVRVFTPWEDTPEGGKP